MALSNWSRATMRRVCGGRLFALSRRRRRSTLSSRPARGRAFHHKRPSAHQGYVQFSEFDDVFIREPESDFCGAAVPFIRLEDSCGLSAIEGYAFRLWEVVLRVGVFTTA